MGGLFYRPEGAWAADFIPFFCQSRFRLFYLLDWRDRAGHGEGTPWYQVSTGDFVHFTEHGEMLPRGAVDAQDLYVFTGSVIESEGLYHIFYTGHNPHLRARGGREQGVMHATSRDLLHWQKVPEDTFYAPTDIYEPHDWRDPFVFWNEEVGEYWMLLAARLHTGPSRRRGCTALCTSRDLRHWQPREPFWAPGLYYTHECPDLFRIGDWWYLVFSEFSQGCLTRYRMSRSLTGPWAAPADDTFDGRAYYAAKTASDGRRRYLFGWNPTREGDTDEGKWQWGGNLVVHELCQQRDGTLAVRVPDSVDRAFGTPLAPVVRSVLGECRVEGRAAELRATSAFPRQADVVPSRLARQALRPGFACATAGPLPECCKVTASVTFAEHTRACGLMLRVSDDLDRGYYVRLEPTRNRLVLDYWPRAGDLPYMVGLERPLALRTGWPLELQVFVDGTVCEIYVGGTIAMSARLYNLRTGDWGVFVEEGVARFENLRVAIPDGCA